MPHNHDKKLAEIAELVKQSQRVLFITGAGLSADSGLPTYRGVGGLYDQQHTEDGYAIEECLSGSLFRTKPELTWKYMLRLGIAVAEHRPNDAHRIIATWEQRFAAQGGKVVVLTQNIDGYHRAAGSKNVYELHGSLGTLHCTECTWSESFDPDTDVTERLKALQQTIPPRCQECNAVIRPGIVLFEEMLPLDVFEGFHREFNDGRGFDLVFSIGTSGMFPYITGPVRVAADKGIPTVEINPTESNISRYVRIHLPLSAAEALREIEQRVTMVTA
jgi:NAD-dependent deacetylase